MKTLVAFVVALFLSAGMMAQTLCHDDMETIFGKDKSFGGFIGFGSKLTELNKQDAVLIGGELSMVFGHSLNVGVAGYGLASDVSGVNVSDLNERLYYDMGYGGLLLEPVFFSKKAVHFSVPLLFGAGGIGESRRRLLSLDQIDDPTYEDPIYLNSDFFLIFEPGMNIELNLLRFVRMYGGVSYRLTNGVDLPNTASSRIDGLSGNIGFRFGWF